MHCVFFLREFVPLQINVFKCDLRIELWIEIETLELRNRRQLNGMILSLHININRLTGFIVAVLVHLCKIKCVDAIYIAFYLFYYVSGGVKYREKIWAYYLLLLLKLVKWQDFLSERIRSSIKVKWTLFNSFIFIFGFKRSSLKRRCRKKETHRESHFHSKVFNFEVFTIFESIDWNLKSF